MTGDQLRDWMAAHGYSVRGLAAALDVAPATVQSWRSGTYVIPKDIMDRLDGLRRPYEYLALTPAEACLILEAFVSHGWSDGDSRTTLVANVYDSLGLPDSEGDNLAAAWEIPDPRGLLVRVAALTDQQAAGLLRAIRSVWEQADGTRSTEDLAHDAGILRPRMMSGR